MPSYPPREMSEAERRRRAAARARRKKEIRRNRIIFAILCLALLALIVFGMVKLVGLFTKDKDSSSGSTSISSSTSISASGDSTSEPASGSESGSASTSDSASATGTAATTGGGDADWLLTLVNNNVKLPDGWEDTLEVKVADESTGKELATVAADAFINMKNAAAAEGIDLMLCSGYRTVEYQQSLFDAEKQKWLDKGSTEEEAYNQAKTVVAVPGYSEHNSGLAADIVTPKHQNLDEAFGKTDAAKWLFEHAPEYGFILRYPENKQAITGIIYEPWHYRYVGVENAKAITASGLCLEEYLDENLRQA
ncbi:M15 family metallopeptidase [Allofournierella massiliensis]|uniref:D-alanyl-D-alanine carboxypeptidase n=1 Tax=Allofournierella massiliensis TaxID=1650663 RepID=A0A4R1R1J3_9FIRM|nr:M15 family metallopeptidase [Fournierella massiliensis]TCL59210.1 D-alanyl-D-alanine carboxypeptidase [Fournierella massiliensis]